MLTDVFRVMVNNLFKENFCEKRKKKKIIRVCLVTLFSLIFCCQKQFYIFETKKLVWQPKMDRKQKLLLICEGN